MKCIKCQTDNKLKERKENNGKCKSCKHPFTFDPKISDSFTDQYFANALSTISVNDSLYFTPRQFYYFFNSRKYATKWKGLGCITMVLGVAMLIAGIATSSFFLLFVFLLLFGTSIALWLPPVQKWLRGKMDKKVKADIHQVNQWLERWMANNGKQPKLLPPPAQQTMPAKLSQEVTAYSFDRAVICENKNIAHFLIANNFHFENNCAVLSVDGYPQSIFSTVLEMLHRNPELKVYALHDASPLGVQLVHHLRTGQRWFAESHGVTIYDLGLLPRQVMQRPMFIGQDSTFANQARAIPVEVCNSLTPEELKWLGEGKYVELESLAPMMLLKLLRDGIAKSRNPQEDDALVMVGDGGYYGGSDVAVYSVDSFG
ncbi:MAG: hypothetical protein JST84_11120 [Acidobacteria bacterium]|nr:hypothetical protein [Acidobacteriota bacterium]